MTDPQIQALIQQAVQSHRVGRLHDAEMIYRRILAAWPDYAEAYDLLGVLATQAGNARAGQDLFAHAVKLNPKNAEFHLHLGMAHLEQGKSEEALASLRTALTHRPDYAQAMNYMGTALKNLGRLPESIESCRRAVEIQPNYPEGWCTLAAALIDDKQYDEGIAACYKSLEQRPDYPNALCNLGVALTEQMKLEEALPIARRAVELKPNFPEAIYNLANALRDLGQLDEAIATYRQALQLRPHFPDAHWNLSLALLRAGQLREGFVEYEWRWTAKKLRSSTEIFRQPIWNGGDLAGKTILLCAEQGFGDSIQFIRYLPQVAKLGGKIVFGCQPELKRLFNCVASIDQWILPGEKLPKFDTHCPLPSLPLVMRTALETIPAGCPYLTPDPNLVEQWRPRVPPNDRRLKVGIIWAGSPLHARDNERSISLSQFSELAKIKNVWFASLQKGEAAAQAQTPPEGMDLADFSNEIEDFADAAALISHLDLVIGVDTAAIHLAGALAKPVWALIPFAPDWRWMTGREDSPWYPTMRLFRQEKIWDWEPPIRRVAQELTVLARSSKS